MLDLALRATAAAFLLASAVQLATKHRQRPAGVPGALLCCGLIAYLAAPYALAGDRSTALAFVVLALATANPPLIWLLARAVFRERLGIGAAQLLAAATGVVINLTFAYELPRRLFGETPLAVLADQVVPHGIALGFVLLAIVDAQRDVHSDLVEPRRRLRVVFVTAIATYAAIVAVVETALRGDRAPAALDLTHVGLLVAAAIGAAFVVFKHGDNLLGREASTPLDRPAEPPRPELELKPHVEPLAPLVEDGSREQEHPTPRAPVDPLLEELAAWIARKGFLEPELSVAQLARTLRTQEYKLRRLLNGQLGFRNFNDFLHRHRVQAACERLTHFGAELSITELSLDVGYGSLATFNRAFKEITGVSPTEYRARHASSKTRQSPTVS